MDFPRFVYSSPGGIRTAGGACYKYVVVFSKAEFDAKLAEGWFSTEAEAIDAAGDEAFLHGLNDRQRRKMLAVLAKKPKKAPPPPKVEVAPIPEPDIPDDDAPPNRDELEAKALELGVRFDGRTSDARLLKRIENALSEV
jgi:hypothetical protein